jgi:hypothetical protein
MTVLWSLAARLQRVEHALGEEKSAGAERRLVLDLHPATGLRLPPRAVEVSGPTRSGDDRE